MKWHLKTTYDLPGEVKVIGLPNASPLIYLGKIGALPLLPQIFEEVWTTPIVRDEVLVDTTAPEYGILTSAFSSWLLVEESANKAFEERVRGMQIHAGEASIISLASMVAEKDPGMQVTAILDDVMARDVARTLGIEVTGTLGVILRCARENLISISSGKQFINTLAEETTFRMSTKVFSLVMQELDSIET
ncbi:MAG TPA: DUF3368 domain-containing protein [Candidatus Lokiarchaeia archaeon]|nr:DUF3368 domain-containing protein [Candidatus Lokiarchaeia archaeon]